VEPDDRAPLLLSRADVPPPSLPEVGASSLALTSHGLVPGGHATDSRSAHETLDELVERCPFGVYIVDSHLRISRMNRRSQEGAFVNVRPVIGRTLDEAMHILWPDDVATEIVAAFRRVLQTGEPFRSSDFVHRRADKARTESYEWELHRLTLPDQTAGVVCYFYDSTPLRSVTELVEAELSAQRLLQEVGTLCARQGTVMRDCVANALDAAIAIAGADKGNLQLRNETDGRLVIAAERGFDRPFLEFFASVGAGECAACGAAARAGTRVAVEDVERSELFAGQPAQRVLLEAGVRAVQSTPLVASDGSILGIISTHYSEPHRFDPNVLRRLDALARQMGDYLQRARADESLRRSESRYRAVVESQSEMVCRFRADGTILFANEAYANAIGLTAAELEGKSFWPHVSAADRRQVQATLDSLSPARPEIRVENRFETATGPRWTLWVNRALSFDDAGRCVEAQSTGLDITDRKRVEERLRANRDAFHGLVQNAPFGVYLVDADFRLAEVSAGAAATFAGVDPLLGRDFAEILRTMWSEPFASRAIEIFRHTLASGERFVSGDFAERRADRGSEEAYDWRTERVVMPDGRFGVVCYFYELTAQRRLEHELRLANQRSEAAVAALRESDRRKDEFLATLSHELRNPLAPMLYGLEVLEQASGNLGAAAAARDMMRRQMTHLVRLMDDLLDVSRISRGKITLKQERVELTRLIADAAEAARLVAAGADQKIELDLADEELYVEADPVRLAQIAGNLLNNACRYSDRGARIVCTLRREADDAVFTVKDEGIGIPPERMGELFDLFNQLERTLERSRGGLGIGLHLVKRLVEMHGGSVAARSAGLGKGSEFTVRLPLMASARSAGTAKLGNRSDRHGAAGPRRVLVVDDNFDAAQTLAMLLHLSGRETAVAHDGREAVERATDFEPDAILLDIGMPNMNGYDACRAIRATPQGRDALIVALSGYGTEDDRRKSAEAGFDAHLVKPVDPEALEQLLAGAEGRASRPGPH
jgi:PAS domain S-box-containing protein